MTLGENHSMMIFGGPGLLIHPHVHDFHLVKGRTPFLWDEKSWGWLASKICPLGSYLDLAWLGQIPEQIERDPAHPVLRELEP